jgi:hypothetical protein
MGPDGAANIIFKREIDEAADPAALRKEKIEEYKAEFANPYKAARRGYVDDVIDPAADEAAPRRSPRRCSGKREPAPAASTAICRCKDGAMQKAIALVIAVAAIIVIFLAARERPARNGARPSRSGPPPRRAAAEGELVAVIAAAVAAASGMEPDSFRIVGVEPSPSKLARSSIDRFDGTRIQHTPSGATSIGSLEGKVYEKL